MMTEVWEVLADLEYSEVWDRVYSKLNFRPSIQPGVIPFCLDAPADIYDISEILSEDDEHHERMDRIIRKGFIKMMGDDDYLYALDWHHTGFCYDPRITEPKKGCSVRFGRSFSYEYSAYFPSFYPDGDYYFFIAQDFEWGYLSHPWQQTVWIFGEKLREYFHKHANMMKFVLLEHKY